MKSVHKVFQYHLYSNFWNACARVRENWKLTPTHFILFYFIALSSLISPSQRLLGMQFGNIPSIPCVQLVVWWFQSLQRRLGAPRSWWFLLIKLVFPVNKGTLAVLTGTVFWYSACGHAPCYATWPGVGASSCNIVAVPCTFLTCGLCCLYKFVLSEKSCLFHIRTKFCLVIFPFCIFFTSL
jgi:hypothetical protein